MVFNVRINAFLREKNMTKSKFVCIGLRVLALRSKRNEWRRENTGFVHNVCLLFGWTYLSCIVIFNTPSSHRTERRQIKRLMCSWFSRLRATGNASVCRVNYGLSWL